MTDAPAQPPISLSIAAVERDTGLSKDTLRVWERRYGFPAPERDALGERAYPAEQVEKLRLVRRLLDGGHRPGGIVPLTLAQLRELARQSAEEAVDTSAAAPASEAVQELLALIRSHDAAGLRGALRGQLARLGVARFVAEVVSPLGVAVGEGWMHGQLEVFEEHLFTEATQNVLRQALAALPAVPADARPRVLLSTLPGEQHLLGLLMAELVLTLEGCTCISLGVQTPLWDIVRAAAACRADIVGLSFSGCMGPNPIFDGLTELRAKLPPRVRLWAGGTAPVLFRRSVAGVDAFRSLDEVPQALRLWRGRA
ncbi:Cobalamin-binding protein [Rubrivivax sp. A210]|uniref:MerR family transcriptional regulator n=1 Tax=Rubrivivax sp. A210 TaxID=2772301 RepID=UPI00191A8D6E|nr:MerR family transcriptional regulator [Rubrivivax sp. A210]CAD5373117.1 Cobalamin-binding protein [Rubrivivax sp. A210]